MMDDDKNLGKTADARGLAALFVLCLAALAMGCEKKTSAPAAPASASASASAAPQSSAQEDDDDKLEPVYPLSADPPDPLAVRFCEAIHALPAQRKAECCATPPGTLPTSECTRMLSAALRAKAVSLDETKVTRCAEDTRKALEGCSWTGPMTPMAASSCDGIITGMLGEGQRCRSSLECVDGLRCRGLGPTHVGLCAKPLPAGSFCAIAVDPLAVYTRQVSFESRHPECTGYCGRRQCAEPTPLGGACHTSAECGSKRYCVAGKCAEVDPPGVGQPCLVHLCAEGARCIKGMCTAPRDKGAACTSDIECRGVCRRGDGGAKGVCADYCGAQATE